MHVNWKQKQKAQASIVVAELPQDPDANERVNEDLPDNPVTESVMDAEFLNLMAAADEGVAGFNDFGIILDKYFKSDMQTEGPGFDSSEGMREMVYEYLQNAKVPLENLQAHINAKIDSLKTQLQNAHDSFSTDITNRRFSQ